MGNTDSKLVRPGDSQVPCFAILVRKTSELKLVNLGGGSSSSVKIADHRSLGIVTIGGEVYVVTRKEILKLRSDGTTEHLSPLPVLHVYSRVVSFQKKIYFIQPGGKSMLCFDPADNSLIDDLPGCGLGYGFCASATDDFICAMGGNKTKTQAMKYDPLKRTWEETAPMRKGRFNAAAATLDGKIYAMGGVYHGASVEYYNPGNNSWTEISNMNVRHAKFSACVDGDRLYAVGGDGQEKNGFYQLSIQVYDKNEWTVVTKFQTKNLSTYSCFWPHGSHQPDSTHSKDFPESVENMYSLLRSEHLLATMKKIGSKKEKFDFPGWKFNLPEKALKEEKEVTLSARVGVDQKKGMPDITPTFECNPPVTFEKPVSMTMRTSISAPAGKEIPATLLTRDHPGDEWKETKKLRLGSRNQVDFEIQHFGGIKVAAKSSDVKLLHSINGFHINLDNGMTAVTFSKDQAVYAVVEKSMCKSGFVDLSLIPHEILANCGSEISVSMEQKKPDSITISEGFPSPTITFDEEYLLMGKKIVYFKLDPEPSDQCRMISMQYGYKLSGDLERHLPLKIKRPRKETETEDADYKLRGMTLDDCKFHGGDEEIDSYGNIMQKYSYNCSFNTTANQVAIGGGTNMSGAENITGLLEDETDSKPTTTSDEIDDESESAMIAVKSGDGTDAKTGVDLQEKTILKPRTISKEIVDKLESATKIAMESDDGTEAETRGATVGGILDNELQHLEFQYIPLSADKKIGPEGGNLSVDESSLTIPPKSLVDTQNLSISMLMDFQNLDLPADGMPVSPYLDIKFRGKLRIPAKVRVPTWFRPSEDSKHGITIYKRYRDEENKFAWRELQNEVTVHDEIIEFEVDHFCRFVAMRKLNLIKDRIWGKGVIKLSHGLFHRGENFLSVVCYRSPKSLFQQMIAHLKEIGHKEIYCNRFVMKSTQKIPIRMECFDPHLHQFEPQQYLLTPSNVRANKQIQFAFLLQQLNEPKDAVKIKYIVDEFRAPFKVTLFDPKEKDLLKLEERLQLAEKREAETREENALLKREKSEIKKEEENLKKESKAMRKVADENKHVTSALTFNIGDGATLSINSLHAGDKGDVSTITNQGAGNNFVAGSQENTDRSVTAGKAIYGQSTSSTVGENITVNRSGK